MYPYIIVSLKKVGFLVLMSSKCDTDHSLNVSWTLHETSVLIASASNEGSGKPAQMRRLARAFAAR